MASKIFDKLLVALIQKDDISVFVHTKDQEYFEVIDLAQHLVRTNKLSTADIVLVNEEKNIPQMDIALFTTNINIYKNNTNALGVFFWKHGHPKIIFSKQRLEKFGINLSPKWSKYIQRNTKHSL